MANTQVKPRCTLCQARFVGAFGDVCRECDAFLTAFGANKPLCEMCGVYPSVDGDDMCKVCIG